MAKYLFDTNIFISLKDRYPRDIYPTLWTKIEELIDNGTIISSMEVYDELMFYKDEIAKWAENRVKCFLPSDVEVQQYVINILEKYPQLVVGGKKKNSADPFVIALAMQQKCKVVTEEKINTNNNNNTTPKIPNVCCQYGVDCINLVDFQREEKFSF